MQQPQSNTLVRPVRRQRAAPGVAGAVGGGLDAQPAANTIPPPQSVLVADTQARGPVAAISGPMVTSSGVGAGGGDDYPVGVGGHAGAGASHTQATTIALLGPEAQQYASLISSVVPMSRNANAATTSAQQQQQSSHEQQAAAAATITNSSANVRVYYSIPTAQTPVNEVVRARLVQNVSKYLASFFDEAVASGMVSQQMFYENNNNNNSGVRVYHFTPAHQLACGFLESPSFGGGATNADNFSSSSVNNFSMLGLTAGQQNNSFAGGGAGSKGGTQNNNNVGSFALPSQQHQDSLSSALAAVNERFFMSSSRPKGSATRADADNNGTAGAAAYPSSLPYGHHQHPAGFSVGGSLVMSQADIDAENNRWITAQQGRVKTTHGVLVMNLRIGCEPPDVDVIEPCAKLECWLDPKTMHAKYQNKGAEKITEVLEAQYKNLSKDVSYKRVVEGSMEEAKAAMLSARKKARKERDGRVLVHYNGHGTPRATQYGEVWFTGKEHFYPFPIYDICMAVESPAIYVFDCNSAGSLLSTWRTSGLMSTSGSGVSGITDIFLCACSEGELLPTNSLLPADLLTSCLTTPLTVALEWYIHYSNRLLLLPNVTAEMIRHLPGDASNRRTPLGELHVVLGSILDSIAWCTMPRESYYPVLRNDQLVRNLFRNFFLADRLMREVGCTPLSHPPIPESAHSHYLWDTWEVVLEGVLAQLPAMLDADLRVRPGYQHTPTRYFVDQLDSFELWLTADDKIKPPEHLPTLILCLSQTTHRMRALLLICRYLEIGGPGAVHSVLYCGLGNLITRFLGHTELWLVLICVWLLILRVDPTWSVNELHRIGAEQFFIRFLFTNGNAFKLLNGYETAIAEAAAAAAAVNATQQQKLVAEAAAQLQTVAPTAVPVNTTTTADVLAAAGGAPLSSLLQPSTPQYVPMTAAAAAASTQQPLNTAATAAASEFDEGNIPSYCAYSGITVGRCRAMSLYLLSRMVEIQQELIYTQLVAQQSQQQQQGAGVSRGGVAVGAIGIGGGGGSGVLHYHHHFIPSPFSSSSSPLSSKSGVVDNTRDGQLLNAHKHAFLTSVSHPAPTPRAAFQIWNSKGIAAAVLQLFASGGGSGTGGVGGIGAGGGGGTAGDHETQSWALLFLTKMVNTLRCAKESVLRELTTRRDLFYPLLDHPSPTVRASCVSLLGSLLGTRIDLIRDAQDQDRRMEVDKTIFQLLSQHISDPSREVRLELTVAAGCLIASYYPLIKLARAQRLLPSRFSDSEKLFLSQIANVGGGGGGGGVVVGGGYEQSSLLNNNANNSNNIPSASTTTTFGGNGNGENNNNTNNGVDNTGDPNVSSTRNSGQNTTGEWNNNTATAALYVTEDLVTMNTLDLGIPERDIGVASALSSNQTTTSRGATQPTTASTNTNTNNNNEHPFSHLVQSFSNLNIITADDPLITSPWVLSSFSRYQLLTIESLVHDALVVMGRMACGCDAKVAKAARDVFSSLVSSGTAAVNFVAQAQAAAAATVMAAPAPSFSRDTNNNNNTQSTSSSPPLSWIIHLAKPASGRVTREAGRTMRSVSSVSAPPLLSEADRVRERRNTDLMHQVVLGLRPSRMISPVVVTGGMSGNVAGTPISGAPGSSSNFPSGTPASSPTSAIGGLGASDFNGMALYEPTPQKVHHSIRHILPIPGHEPIVSHQFRALEPHVITVERNNRISVISYEDNHYVQLLESFQHTKKDPITSGLLVNDLADFPLYMVVDKAGIFTLYNNLLTGRPSVVSSFDSNTGARAGRYATSSFPSSTLSSTLAGEEVICAYRPLDSSLFYGRGSKGINVLSVGDEQLIQTIETPSNGAISSIFTQGHGGRIVIAGFTDGIIRMYDDRGRGTSSLYNTWETKPAASRTSLDAVVGVGVAGESSVYASTRNSLILFDIRQTQRPLKVVTAIPETIAPRGGAGSGISNHHHLLSSFSMCSHFGLMATMTNEGVCDIYNARLESLLVCGLPVNLNHTYYNTVLQQSVASLGGGGSGGGGGLNQIASYYAATHPSYAVTEKMGYVTNATISAASTSALASGGLTSTELMSVGGSGPATAAANNNNINNSSMIQGSYSSPTSASPDLALAPAPTPQQRAQDIAIAFSHTRVPFSFMDKSGAPFSSSSPAGFPSTSSSPSATSSARYAPLRVRWDNAVNKVTFHPMKAMAVFGNELVTLHQTHHAQAANSK